MRHLLMLGALAGCFSPSYHSGGLVCGSGQPPCPDGYHCAADHFCWKNGEDPDLAGSPADLSTVSADLSQARDLETAPGDLGTTPVDFAGVDGNHQVKATTAGGGGKAAGSKHSITLSIGQKTSGVAAGTAHRVQLGVLRGTQAK